MTVLELSSCKIALAVVTFCCKHTSSKGLLQGFLTEDLQGIRCTVSVILCGTEDT